MKEHLKRWQRPISTILVLVSIGWISFALWESRGELPAFLSTIEPTRFAIAVFMIAIEFVIISYVYFLVLCGASNAGVRTSQVMMRYLISQVVRYLPGRVWGHLYLIQTMADVIPIMDVVKANIRHFLLITIYSVSIAAAVLAYNFHAPGVAVMLFAVTQVLIFAALRGSLLGWDYCGDIGSGRIPKILVFLFVDWFVYFLACTFILPESSGVRDTVNISTCYAIAWLAGSLAVVVPGGLFVREASFIWLGALLGYGLSEMLTFGIAARILFTVAEVVCAALSVLFLSSKCETGMA